ncbi:hypothetical protein [Streptococcus sobrinus]|uniref:DUF4145 domain-containing protein n=1 Tax=Streptococcus sobrinus TaxID=1310 RepID=A0ABN5LFQ4_9STRE|nr:hypothetical protein [Streptococcus sobrinus]AWN19923.1 hypothetical protein DK182_00415 [Streptococcus sobrinus]EMP72755.1 hypothetical protein D823_01245 [Streptococcus sobrinus DSM 20742 = ATCC 33478]SQG12626.1 Uncharacterised protein [Streptococcus sobrinus]
MTDFSSSEYEQMIGDLIHDTFYVELSRRGKIKGIRQFSEVLIRKILNVGSDKKLMLGQVQRDFRRELNFLQEGRKDDLLEIIEKIRPLGNEGTHTQHTAEFSDDELNQVKDGLFDLYAYLFIDYFLKYPMDLLSPAEVMSDFSLLPPIVRYKALKYLYEKEPNLQIVNRYCLSIIKTYDKPTAFRWLEEERERLYQIHYPTQEEAKEYYINRGVQISPDQIRVSIQLWRYSNVYDLLKDKITDSRTSVNESGKMYSTFEEAKSYYLANRSEGESKEINELREIIDFVYLGREALV